MAQRGYLNQKNAAINPEIEETETNMSLRERAGNLASSFLRLRQR